jgi:hypothetical protein
MKSDQSLLQAALVGYQARIVEIENAMADIRQQLGQKPASAAAPVKVVKVAGRRKMSAAGRKRIAAAQKKRWADYNAKKAAEK